MLSHGAECNMGNIFRVSHILQLIESYFNVTMGSNDGAEICKLEFTFYRSFQILYHEKTVAYTGMIVWYYFEIQMDN